MARPQFVKFPDKLCGGPADRLVPLPVVLAALAGNPRTAERRHRRRGKLSNPADFGSKAKPLSAILEIINST
jgi:hypothetical protein